MNLDNLQYAHLMHAVSHDINLGAQFYIQQSWIAQSLLSYGTEEQKAQWLPGLATGQMKGAFALAEEASGSDHANMTCRATPGRNGSFELRGSKTWVSLAEEADFFLLFCKVPIADGQQDFGAMIDKLPWTKHMPGPQPIPRVSVCFSTLMHASKLFYPLIRRASTRRNAQPPLLFRGRRPESQLRTRSTRDVSLR